MDRSDSTRAEPHPRAGPAVQRRLPLPAFTFVVVALVVLALAPAVQMERVAAVGREVATTLLPAYDGLRVLALAMERQSVAVRGYILSGAPEHAARFSSAWEIERDALAELDALAGRISPAAAAYHAELQRLSLHKHRQNVALVEAGAQAYAAALPQLEATRDSMLLHVAGIEGELVRVTEAMLADERRAAAVQRVIAFGLGALAIVAALIVGWFAVRQRRLTLQVESALADANLAHAEAERRRTELERMTESRARLMRGFSHDVKNPLGAASGHLQLLADGVLGPLDERQQRSAERAVRSIAAAINLLDDLLDMAHAERGELGVEPEPIEIAAVVRDAAEEYRAQAEARGLRLDVHVPEPSPVVTTDGRRVRQILGNLIANAVKYTSAGGVSLRLETSRGDAPDRTPEGVAILVADTGPGIPADLQRRLFQEYVRLDPGTAPGLGIGLAISRRIAHALGGEISVRSEPGVGSTFTLWLPPAAPAAPAAPTSAGAPNHSPSPSR